MTYETSQSGSRSAAGAPSSWATMTRRKQNFEYSGPRPHARTPYWGAFWSSWILRRIMAAGAMVSIAMSPSCRGAICDDVTLASFDSPGKTRTARVLVRSCGATTGFATIVQVGSGNAYHDVAAFDSDHGRVKEDHLGSVPMVVTWLGESELRLQMAPGTRSFPQKAALNDPRIEYLFR